MIKKIMGITLTFLFWMGLGLGIGKGSLAYSMPVIDSLIDEAMQNSPGLEAEGIKLKSLHSTLEHGWYLENPEIGVEFYESPLSAFPSPIKNQMEIDYSLEQTFPFPGKISSRNAVQNEQIQMGEAEVKSRKQSLVLEVKSEYYSMVQMHSLLAFNQENKNLMRKMKNIVQKQYEFGLSKSSDIIKVENEITNLEMDSIRINQEFRAHKNLLETLLNGNKKSQSRNWNFDSLMLPEINWTWVQMRPLVDKSHPRLQYLQARKKMAEAEKIAAGREFFPDFTLGGKYKDMLRSQDGVHSSEVNDYWSISASMTLPFAFWSAPKNRANQKQAAFSWQEAIANLQEEGIRIEAKAQAAYEKAKSFYNILQLSQKQFLPRLEQDLQNNLSLYQNGKGEFSSLFEAYRDRILANQSNEFTKTQYLISVAELEESLGLSLKEIGSQND